ncbi:MAG: GNAT family N-acetyltransferase [Clostridia bacterium]|nr:GNAT family N-acetyltransferase [Clostridia bacterium]
MDSVSVIRVTNESPLWAELIAYADQCSWAAGGHLAYLMREHQFTGWESVFAALDHDRIAGYCTLMNTDYYPENRYSPWISSIFVGESYRGRRISGQMIRAAEDYARSIGFTRAYIPSDMTGFYERYGYEKIDELVNYGGDTDHIFSRSI